MHPKLAQALKCGKEMLLSGDVVGLNGDRMIGVEIKRTHDLVSSWKSKRLARQMRLLRLVYDTPVLLCVDPAKGGKSGQLWTPKGGYRRTEMGLWGDLLSLQDDGIRIVVCSGEHLLPAHIERVLKHVSMYASVEYAPHAAERRLFIPGVGVEREGRLLEKFGSVRALANASAEEVSAVKGFGKKMAQEVVDWFGKEQA